MSEVFLMYVITTGVFVIFTGILFGVRTKRINQETRTSSEEKQVS
ncbi:MAG TPA: hypothetical protein VFY55_07080 [Nitrososphaeraceae archaeon]|nr:hypothetical protein [Nitrososphaeraceae archaeon]